MIIQLRKLTSGPDADFWSTHYVKADRATLLRKLSRDHIAQFLRKHAQGRFLEAGCGSCQYSYALHTAGIIPYGIDYSDEAIASAHKLFPEIKKNIAKGDLFKLPYKNAFFDTYYSPGVIEHYTNPADRRRMLREAYRVLKPGGTFLITVPFATPFRRLLWPLTQLWNVIRKHQGYQFYQYRYTKAELAREVDHAGFTVTGSTTLNPDFFAKALQNTLGKTFIADLRITRELFAHTVAVIATKPRTKQ